MTWEVEGTPRKDAVAAAAARLAASSCANGETCGSRLARSRVELGQLANLTVIGSELPGIR